MVLFILIDDSQMISTGTKSPHFFQSDLWEEPITQLAMNASATLGVGSAEGKTLAAWGKMICEVGYESIYNVCNVYL